MTTKPNVIVILSDDQGPWALGCAGNHEIQTPNLDRLAKQGMRFENFFCVSPVCSPARASLLTGQIPSQHGVHDWIRSGNVDVNHQKNDLSGSFGDEHEPIEYLDGTTAYTDILAENGYICGLSGKWHLGHSLKPQHGFSHWFTIARGGCQYYHPEVVRDGGIVLENQYLTDLITEDALSFLENNANKNQPFYLSVHYTAPHSPWINNHPQEIVDLYDDCAFETCPQEPTHPWYQGAFAGDTREQLKGYFAAVTAMDYGIGRILQKLDASGLRENTLICFLSDNGFSCGHNGFWGKGNGTSPLNMYDNSVKVPAIFSHLDTIPAGIVSDALVSAYDFSPTLLAYLDLDCPSLSDLPGNSFLPVLLGNESDVRENIVVYDEYGPVRMIRTKKWKYVHRYPAGPHELYDLVNDSKEKTNLINHKNTQEKVKVLRGSLEEWFAKYVEPTIDGVQYNVTGKGQRSQVGKHEENAFFKN